MKSLASCLSRSSSDEAGEGIGTAEIFNAISTAVALFIAVMFFGLAFVFVKRTGVAVTTTVLVLLLVSSRIVARRFSIRSAGALLVAGLWLVFTGNVWLSGGVNSVMAGFYIAITAMSGMLLGTRSTFIVAGLSIAACLAMTVLPNLGYNAPRYYPIPPWPAFFVQMFWFILVLPPTTIAIRGLSEGLREARKEIFQRKKAEQALREQEQKYRLLAENTLDVIWQMDLDLHFTYVNPAVTPMTGHTVEEWIGSKLPEHCDKANFARMTEIIAAEIAKGPSGSGAVFDARMIRKTGEPFDVEIHGKALFDDDGHPIALQGVTRDITERKKAEESAALERQRLYDILETMPVMVCLLTPDHHVPFANRSFRAKFGDSDGRHCFDFCFGRKEPCEFCEAYRVLETGEPHHWEATTSDGSILAVYDFPFTDTDGSPLILEVEIDVTAQRKAQKALQESEQRYRTLFDDSKDGVYVTSRDGQVLEANQAYLDLLGYSREEVVGGDIRVIHANPSDGDRFVLAIESNGFIKDYALPFRRKDGKQIDCLITASVRRAEDGSILGYHGIVRDVTEQENLQRQLIRAQKMEAIGTLAGGVAHDFNNVLQVALGYSEIMLDDREFPAHYHSDLQKINESAKRGADLVQRLLTFSRKTELSLLPLDLNSRITDLQKMLERTLPKMVNIQLVLDAKIAKINADKTQIDQVLMNLAVNARDAMPDGGTLLFETANVTFDEGYTRTHVEAKPGPHVLLAVTDTGSGMDKDTLEHIFEPFYTTKGVGEGTGLGLAMVHGIVKQHGGHVTCYSEPGHGTTFKIYFPALVSEGKAEETIERPVPRGGSETILLVDDEEFIRDLGSRILEKAGYTVITASNGKEALEKYKLRRDEIDLVLLDLMMPEMGGKQCLERLLSLNPSVKVIIASGFSASGPTKEALTAGAKGFVNKPYDMRQVREVVRQVLDAE